MSDAPCYVMLCSSLEYLYGTRAGYSLDTIDLDDKSFHELQVEKMNEREKPKPPSPNKNTTG